MIKARIAQANQIRGLLSEFSIILRRGIRSIIKYMPVILADAENGRQLAGWLALVPEQHSSGGTQLLLGISKRGNTCLRTLLVHQVRAVIRFVEYKAESANG